MIYKPSVKKELFYGLGHIALGFIVVYSWIPQRTLWTYIWILAIVGIIREVLQFKRMKIQPIWISAIDVFGIILGGIIWYIVREAFNINADTL